MRTHELQPTEYLYRGHYISLDRISHEWVVTESQLSDTTPAQEILWSGDIDNCKSTVDSVVDDQESGS